MTDPTYALGRSDDEHARLTEQSNFLRPLTERFLRKAGVAPGMKVLDVGSGVGDMAFLLAELVGPEGQVTGVDVDAAALEKASKRGAQLQLRNVEFVHGDIRTAALHGNFDAAVGRLVLLYFADPVAVLAKIATHVRSGGIVAFQEMEMNDLAPLGMHGGSTLAKVVETIYRTFAAAGVRMHMASELRQSYVKAGLGEPCLLGEFVAGGGADFAGYPWLANTMRSLAPMATKLGIPLAPLGDLDTLVQRLRSEAANGGRDFWSPPYVGAFARIA